MKQEIFAVRILPVQCSDAQVIFGSDYYYLDVLLLCVGFLVCRSCLVCPVSVPTQWSVDVY